MKYARPINGHFEGFEYFRVLDEEPGNIVALGLLGSDPFHQMVRLRGVLGVSVEYVKSPLVELAEQAE